MTTPKEVAEALDRLLKGCEMKAAKPGVPVLRIESIALRPDIGVFPDTPYAGPWAGEPAARFEVRFTLDGQPGMYEFADPIVDIEHFDSAELAAESLSSTAVFSPLMQWCGGTASFGEDGPRLLVRLPQGMLLAIEADRRDAESRAAAIRRLLAAGLAARHPRAP